MAGPYTLDENPADGVLTRMEWQNRKTSARRRSAPSLLVLAAVALVGCHHAEPTRVVAGDLAGAWQQPISFPGTVFSFTLTVADSVVRGNGVYAIEAGRSGTMVVTGTVHGTAVTLDFLRDFGLRSQFSGALESRDALSGSFWSVTVPVTDPVPMTFLRK